MVKMTNRQYERNCTVTNPLKIINENNIASVADSLPAPPPAAAAKSLQSCLTLCDPMDGSPPDSAIPGILQARTWSGLPFPSPPRSPQILSYMFVCVCVCVLFLEVNLFLKTFIKGSFTEVCPSGD